MKNKKLIKLVAVVLSIVLIFCFSSCSKSANINSKATTLSTTITTDTKNQTTKKDDKTNKNETTTTTKLSSTKSNATSTTTTVTTNKNIKTTNKATKNNVTTKKSSTTKKVNTTSAPNYCTISIDCKEAVANIDKVDESHKNYVPSSGYILNSTKYYYSKGDTVYDALKYVCDKNGIRVNATNSPYGGKYIVGINNLDEKNCGSQSGWLYFVNGSTPPKSCSLHTISNHDTINFHYTCNG